jgi:hypothetical protein
LIFCARSANQRGSALPQRRVDNSGKIPRHGGIVNAFDTGSEFRTVLNFIQNQGFWVVFQKEFRVGPGVAYVNHRGEYDCIPLRKQVFEVGAFANLSRTGYHNHRKVFGRAKQSLADQSFFMIYA